VSHFGLVRGKFFDRKDVILVWHEGFELSETALGADL